MKLASPPTALAASALLALGLLLAPCISVAEEVYRWVDVEGRVHFSSTPPPSGSAQKTEKWEGSERDVINVVPETNAAPRARRGNTARPAPSMRGASPATRRPASGAERIGGKSEAEWRARAQDLQGGIADLEARIASTEEGPEFWEKTYDDYGGTRYSDNKASRLKRLEGDLGRAESRLDEFETLAREAGVPPGWLR